MFRATVDIRTSGYLTVEAVVGIFVVNNFDILAVVLWKFMQKD